MASVQSPSRKLSQRSCTFPIICLLILFENKSQIRLVFTLSGCVMMSVPFCLYFPSVCSYHLFTASDRSVSLCQFRGLRVVYRPGRNRSGRRHRRRRLRMEREWHSFLSAERSVFRQVPPLSSTHHHLEWKLIITAQVPSVVLHVANKDRGCVRTGSRSKLFSSRLRHEVNVAV